jgi:hypothetical protein
MDTSVRRIDRYLAAPMFGAALLFLLCLSGLLHLGDRAAFAGATTLCLWGIGLLYPLFAAELLLHLAIGGPGWKQHLLFCLAPPLRLGCRDHTGGRRIWLPFAGWRIVGRDIFEQLERSLSLPMIVVALMILPLMGFEYQYADLIADDARLDLVVRAGTGLIWAAFAAEFIVMISIVERKAKYCKEHWIDLAVILLPLVAFLRVGRLARLLRLQQLTRTARIYRLRGVIMKLYRAILLLDVLDRVFRGDGATRLARLRETIAEKEQELLELHQELVELELEFAPPAETIAFRRAA